MPLAFRKKIETLFCCIVFMLASDANAQGNMFHFSEAPSFPQSAPYTYVYAIPVDSVQAIAYDHHSIDPNVAWLRHPAYIIPTGKIDSLMRVKSIPCASYLSVTAWQNQMRIGVHQRDGFFVRITDIERIKILSVQDTAERELRDVVVMLGGKRIPYDEGMRGFVISEFANGDIVSVRKDEDIHFFRCNVGDNGQYQKPEWKNQATESAKREKKFNGYLVTNKPVYLPHDTVKWKAYLEDASDNNRPVHERLRITFAQQYSYSDNKEYHIASDFKGEEPGVYFGEFVLGDSVKMDRVYNLDLYGTRSGLHMQALFKAEDYLLDETHLRVTGESFGTYQPGDSVNLYGYAYNSNNLPVLDGQISITITPHNDYRPLNQFAFIPDTLYSATIPVNPNGETNIGFSTKDFSPALQGFNCKVSLVNSNNEHADTAFSISFLTAERYIRVRQDANRVHAELILNKKSVNGKGRLLVQGANGGKSVEYPISFPYDHIVGEDDYSLTFQLKNDTGGVVSWLQHYVEDARISSTEHFHGDTAILELINPRHAFYRYSIFTGSDFTGYGYAHGDTVIKVLSKKGRTVSFIGSYTWKGSIHRQDFAVFRYDRELDVDLQKKDLVFPGQRDTISIRLSNKKGAAVSKTNVTVLAFNSQFVEDYTASLPYGGLVYPAYVAKEIRSIQPMSQIQPAQILATGKWLSRCGADTMFFYKNLYLLPDDIAWLTYDIPASIMPQVGIYLQRGGYYYHPQYIYVDDRPVYVKQAAGTNPAGFFVEEGWHSLRFRMPEGEYRIPSFEVCGGMKTDMYLNLDSVGPFYRTDTLGDSIRTYTFENHLRSFIYKITLPDVLQESEQQSLGGCLLLYRPEGSVAYSGGTYHNLGEPQFFQGALQIRAPKGQGTLEYRSTRYPHESSEHLIGPLNINAQVRFFQEWNTKLVFEWERDYIYIFRPQMTRMEKVAIKNYLQMRLSDSWIWPACSFVIPNPQDFDSLVVAPAPIATTFEKHTADRRSQPVPRGTGNGPIQPVQPRRPVYYSLLQTSTQISSEKATARVAVTTQNYGQRPLYVIYQRLDTPRQNHILTYPWSAQILPGRYDVIVIWNDRHYSKYASITLHPGGQNLIPASYKDELGLFPFDKAPKWMQPFIKKESIITNYSTPYTGSQVEIPMNNRTAHSTVSSSSGFRGVLKDEKGNPVVNANVEALLEGFPRGRAFTDFDGEYVIKPLNAGRYNVRFSYLGKELTITGIILGDERMLTVNGKLLISTSLKGTTVTTSRYQRSIIDFKSPGGHSTHSAGEIEQSATRNVSDIASLSTQATNDDYMPYRGNSLNLGGGRNSGTNYVIDGVQLSSGNHNYVDNQRGDEPANNAALKGVMLDREGDASKAFFSNFMANMMGASGMRKSFRDWAIWEPDLWTDKNGATAFNVTYPDNLTSWKTYVLAMNQDGYTARVLRITRAFKPLSAQLSIPRFLRYGDTAEGLGKVANYSQEAFNLRSAFIRDGQLISGDTMLVHNTRVQHFLIAAPVVNVIDTGLLPVSYSITAANGYTDGEERSLPILPVGVTESKGDFFYLNADSTVNSRPDSLSGHFTGRVRVQVDGSLLEVMLREVENLKEYPHGCNEQLTTKLLAIYYEEAIKKLMGRTDFNNTLTKKEILEQLVRAQRPDGGFGWWSNNGGDYRITNYIIGTMQKVNGDGWLSYIIRRGQSYLNNQLSLMQPGDQLASMQTLSAGGYVRDYRPFLDKLDSTQRFALHDRLVLIKIRKEQGLPYRAALDSVMKERRESANEGIYWGERNYDWYRDDLASTLLVYSIVKTDSVYGRLSTRIMRYILFKKKRGYYGSTAASGLVLTTILPDLLAQQPLGSAKMPTYIRLSGSINDSITTFPKTFSVREQHPVFSITKKGLSPAYVTVVYDYFNTNPVARDSDFIVRTHFINANRGDTATTLKAGEKITLRTTVTCKKEGEYIMIEVPIPAGCIQVDKSRQYYAYPEAAREHFKDQTDIFCNKLQAGTYTFDVTLEARYKGTYNISPARAGLMYYPEAYGNTPVKRVSIR